MKLREVIAVGKRTERKNRLGRESGVGPVKFGSLLDNFVEMSGRQY